jgi:general secretion pathway protein N
MRLTTYHALAAAMAALLGVLVLEVSGRHTPAAPEPAAPPLPPTITHAAVAPDVDEAVRVVLARPLFATNRRPLQPHPTAAVSADQSLPRLTGVFVSPWSRSAIFQPANAKPVVVREGAVVAGWTIRSIDNDAITLARADQSQTIRPHFDFEKGAKITVVPVRQPSAPKPGLLMTRWTNPHLQP